MRLIAISRIAAIAAVMAVPALSVAQAQAPRGAYDGMWIVDVEPSPVIVGELESTCPALRLPVQIAQGRFESALHRVPTSTGGIVIEGGAGAYDAPIVGSVDADGSFHAQWQGFHATGKLAGNEGQLTVQTECGPAAASAVRVSQ